MTTPQAPRLSAVAHSTWFVTVRNYFAAHKILGTIAVIIVLYGAYYGYGVVTAPSTATRYVTTTVATGTVVASITETGQVSASSNVSIQSQSSGEVLSIPVAAGQHVGAGAALAYLDPTSAQHSLQSTQITLAKLQEPATAASLTSAENTVASAETNLVQTHQNGYNDISAAFLTLPTVITGLDAVLHGSTVPGRTSSQNESAYSDITQQYDPTVVQYSIVAENSYQTAYASYTKALADFRATSRNADDATIEALINESYQAAANLSDALKASTNFLNFVNTTLTLHNVSLPSTLAGHISTLTGYTTTMNGHVVTLSTDAATVASNERALAAAQASLAQIKTGADPLDIQSAQLSLSIAQQALADTVVRAPFSGTVAKLAVQQYQTIGSGTAVATLVSDNQSVAISVNEVDAAKLKVGEKATLTFDALPNISIAGTVSSVDTIGTVSSGVVSYGTVVTFDTPNTSVKPGMSATADIITGTETGLVVPSSAVKGPTGQNYVEVFSPALAGSETSTGAPSPTAPTRVAVMPGLTDNTNTVIESGLSAGTQVVTRTVAGTGVTIASTAARSTSLFGSGATSGGGAVRALGR